MNFLIFKNLARSMAQNLLLSSDISLNLPNKKYLNGARSEVEIDQYTRTQKTLEYNQMLNIHLLQKDLIFYLPIIMFKR